ncbi:ParB/RepB/Spo0J family partition protein [Tateyamaria sp.]|nr:ParB/RepB/Spo0J family partition protein [Tateyamaria sp.]
MAGSDKKRGLGRGLSALMADVNEPLNNAASVVISDQSVPIEMIVPNPNQPRKTFESLALDDLVSSIQEKGVLQPLIVRKVGEGFEIVAGERRWRAAQRAQLHELPVIVREFTDTEVLEVAIIENIQRSDLNPIEEAAGYKQLMDRFGHTQEKMAEALGKSRSHIANLMRLLNLPSSIQTHVIEGRLSSGHARTLVTIEDSEALVKKIIDGGLSVRQTEMLVKKSQERRDPAGQNVRLPQNKTEKDADTRALEEDLGAATGVKVSLSHKPNAESGQLTLHYSSLEQLDDLCRKLSG